MEKNKLKVVVADQQRAFLAKDDYVPRDLKIDNLIKVNEMVVISGVRRAGKSTLLRIITERINSKENIFYLNFDDERLVNFTVDNFNDLLEIFLESSGKGRSYFFLDEVQNVSNWEKWVNRLYEQENIKVFVTGSNASLLSSEIATSLTGRNITIELFPFSFKEFLRLRKVEIGAFDTRNKVKLLRQFNEYLQLGSFPQVIKSMNKEFLKSYFQDIIYKDIIARYSLRDVKEIKELAVYLASNIGKPLSYNKLAGVTGIKSISTIKNYWDYFQQSFLFFKLNMFSYSVKKQIYNPAKNYCIDLQLANQIGFFFTEDKGRVLENLAFIELKRRGKEIYYHQGKKECDFVIKESKVVEVIQVCQELNDDNWEREIGGLLEALNEYKLKKGLVLTYDQEEVRTVEGKEIVIVPIWKWLLQNTVS